MAKRWQKHTPNGKDLPERVKKSVSSLAAGLRGEELLPDPAKFNEKQAVSIPSWARPYASIRGGITMVDKWPKSKALMAKIKMLQLGHQNAPLYKREHGAGKPKGGWPEGSEMAKWRSQAGRDKEATQRALLPDPANSRERADAFKVGFLRKLAELGVTPNELYARVKSAAGDDALSSMFMGATDVGKSLIGTGLDWAGDAAKILAGVAVAAPVVAGGVTGALSGALNSPSIEDINTLRKTELLEMYKRMTQEISARRARKATRIA
jgi:hypothetical protein